jgi:hypothetical protein
VIARPRAGVGHLLAACLALATIDLAAQAPVANATIEAHAAARGLEGEVRALSASPAPAWIGYRLPAAAGSRRTCATGARVLLEGPAEFFVLARIAAGRVERIRAATPECEIDAGGMRVVWLTNVTASESVAWLSSLVAAEAGTSGGMQRIARPALAAVGMHADAGGVKLLEIARTTPNGELRRQAMTLLSESSDPRTIRLFEEILK